MSAVINGSAINLGLPQVPENVPQEMFNAIYAVHTAIEKLRQAVSQYAGVDQLPAAYWPQISMDDTIYAGNMNRLYVKAYEDLAFGNCVSLMLDAGELKARKADATDATKIAAGFVNNVDGAPLGSFCEVLVATGLITGVSGLVTGDRYWLSTTPGVITNVAPSTPGNFQQVVGLALAGNRLLMNLSFDGVIV